MKKQITALMCAIGMSAAFIPALSVSAETELLFGNEIFSEGSFAIYDEENATGEIQIWDNYGLEAKFEKDWDSNNGVKANVTQYIAGHSGQEFTLSLDATNWAWEGEGINKVYVFFEIEHADNTSERTYIISGPESQEDIQDNTAHLTGKNVVNFVPSDNVYLCMIQGGGTQQYKEISCSTEKNNDDDPSGKRIILDSSVFAEGAFSAYDEENAAGEIAQVWDNYGVEAQFEKEWDVNNGIKADITEYVTGLSGKEFEVSINVTCWAWNGDGMVNKARAFFCTVSPDGDKTITDICSGPDNLDEINDDTASISGSTLLNFSDQDTVYLCFAQGGRVQQYKELILSVNDAIVEPPVETNVLFEDDIFKDGAFEVYDESNESAVIEIWENDGVSVNFNNDWDSNNGVKTNITDYVSGYSGKTFTLEVEATNWAWQGEDGINMMYAFFEVIKEDGSSYRSYIISGPDSEEDINDNTASLVGNTVLEFGASDKIYLCLTHGGGSHQYRNIKFSVNAPDNSGNITVSTPELGVNGAYIDVSNTTKKDASINIYAVTYENGTVKTVKTQTITIPSGAINEAYTIIGNEGDTIFIWDNGMNPYTNKTEL